MCPRKPRSGCDFTRRPEVLHSALTFRNLPRPQNLWPSMLPNARASFLMCEPHKVRKLASVLCRQAYSASTDSKERTNQKATPASPTSQYVCYDCHLSRVCVSRHLLLKFCLSGTTRRFSLALFTSRTRISPLFLAWRLTQTLQIPFCWAFGLFPVLPNC